MIGFGLLGYFLRRLKYDLAPLVLALVLGPMMERSFREAMMISRGNLAVFVSRPQNVPTFVYAITIVQFVLFFSFAVNMALQYMQVGRWRDYRHGERWYLWLSLVAKSLLAWQVFANVLVL